MLTAWRKTRARTRALAARARAHAEAPQAGQRLVEHFPDALWPTLNQTVAGFAAIRDEIDPQPLLETFALEQARLALPCVVAKDQPLVFRSYAPGDTLSPGAFQVPEPDPSSLEVSPTLILVPLVAFDAAGRRLGYGAGFYDRTLAALEASGPIRTVGLAYEAQRLSRVPTGPHDRLLDWIVTEQGAYRGRG